MPPRARVERDEIEAKQQAGNLTRELGRDSEFAVLGDHAESSTLLKQSKAYLVSRRREDEEVMVIIEGRKRLDP